MTNREWLEMATKTLMAGGDLARPEAHLHARLLLDSATGERFAHLVAPELALEATTLQKLQQWLSDATRGRPIPYILGKAPFWGLEWEVDERVLIPRPETELLVETTLELLPGKTQADGLKIAELGYGSGIISVSLKKSRPDAELYALDVSPDVWEIATRNARSHGVDVWFMRSKGDWIAPLTRWMPFDAIVSNPPYIATAEIENLEAGVRDFEPRLALDGGPDGLDPYRAIARDGQSVLSQNGFVAVEVGAGQFTEISTFFWKEGWHVEAARRDLAGIERVLVARLAI